MFLVRLLTNPKYFWILAVCVILGDAILSELIIRFIAYTEIDWETYMIQVQLYLKGERDYSKISGPTGPLVYPAGHVYIFRFLHDITDSGKDIRFAQHLYALLYVGSVALTCAIYGKAGNTPNWLLLILPLSKRLHSLYMLRLFNDCWSVVAVQAAILAFQNEMDDIGTVLFSVALSVKMSILLYLPALLVILVKRHGIVYTFRKISNIIGMQAMLAYPFLQKDWRAYVNYAFDFSRVFLYQWTVNWRMIPEDIFLSKGWARGLLIGHLSVLVIFGLSRWCKKDGGVWAVLNRAIRRPTLPAGIAPVTPNDVATFMFTSNLIGLVFARSLHYQFYSWYAQQVPFLVWRTKYPVFLRLLLVGTIEYAWNIYPSTTISSSALLGTNILVIAGVWFAT
ncbi:glycosyltransferase family 58 protein [Collybiopsis luxurians FD-317 M1]|uniref:Dol-P-Man:Man(5)GlcNAc(2)-PP-Dol alpha-1,3-mannosyltransferase n=1 Tax=Collybiopsis luxurians FD-317 M1 TaxID=944289 RepID=A0A0D0CBD7_9AGAR|nr:glycosyltransferase family 58 protein [Collybiopsis luxurians FD-317 M1]